ncbi:MAG: hypothetical protein ABMA26_15070 [Limisphaerales bacterium]
MPFIPQAKGFFPHRIPGAWTPLQLAGLRLWLDSSDAATVHLSGPLVTQWDDKSGQANHASQAAATSRPVYSGGLLGILFDGINDFLEFADSLFTYTGAGTAFFVVQVNAVLPGGYGAPLAEQGGVNQSIAFPVQHYPDAAVEFCTDVYSPGGMRFNATKSLGTPYLVTYTWTNWSAHKTNGNTQVRVSGVAGSIVAFGTDPAGFTSTLKRVGAFGLDGGSYLNGAVMEIIVCNQAVGGSAITSAEAYLTAKWAL